MQTQLTLFNKGLYIPGVKEWSEKHGSKMLKGRQKYMERGQTMYFWHVLFEVTLSACMFFVPQQFPALAMVVKPDS